MPSVLNPPIKHIDCPYVEASGLSHLTLPSITWDDHDASGGFIKIVSRKSIALACLCPDRSWQPAL